MATFNKRRAPTSRIYICEQGIVMPNLSKMFQTFWLHSSIFNLEKPPKNLNFYSFFLPLINRAFGGYFQWNACTYFQKICNWRRYCDAKLIKNISNFLVALIPFCFRKQPKNLNFQTCFTFNRPFGGYFQWKVRTYFQKICNWGRYSDAKLSKSIWNFLFTLLCFCFRKQPKNLNFQSFFYL